MTKRWLIALFIAGPFGDKAFADCVPSPDTPASVIEYFQKLNKPLPEKFCRDYVNDAELRIAIGHKLMELVANGVTHPVRLGYLTLKSLPRH
jgi:hypothetical protein